MLINDKNIFFIFHINSIIQTVNITPYNDIIISYLMATKILINTYQLPALVITYHKLTQILTEGSMSA